MLEAEEVVVYYDVESYIGFSRLLRVKSKKVLDNILSIANCNDVNDILQYRIFAILLINPTNIGENGMKSFKLLFTVLNVI